MHANTESIRTPDFDEWRVLVKRELPWPVSHVTNAQGVTWLAGGETSRVLVRASRRSITVFAFGCRRTADGWCRRRALRVGMVTWSALPPENALALTALLIGQAADLEFDDLPANSGVPAVIVEQLINADDCDSCLAAEASFADEAPKAATRSTTRPAPRPLRWGAVGRRSRIRELRHRATG